MTLHRQPFERWTDEEIEVLRELMWEGRTDREIAEALGTSEQSVYRKRNRLGMKKRITKPFSVNRAQCFAIGRAREAGWTWERISEYAGVHKDTVRRAYIKATGGQS